MNIEANIYVICAFQGNGTTEENIAELTRLE